ncbi:MAG: flavocytochrome c [Firmicutes bacterium]|nr:flavocytochrome c [Bacillota bacterium]
MKKFSHLLITILLVLSSCLGAFAQDKGFIPPPTEWDETYDVVVVGGGFAGLAAAYASHMAGADTVLIEKMPFVGGNSIINGGIYASYTSKLNLNEKLGLPPGNPEVHIQDSIAGGDNLPDPKLVEQFVYGSPVMLNLLLDNGLKVRDMLTRVGGHSEFRTYTTENQGGVDIVVTQYEMIKRENIPVQLNTKMVYIYREEPMKGNVLGIKVQTKEGTKNIRALNGVVLATGGFSADIAMRQLHVPWIDPSVPTTNHVGATGEGIKLAQQVGANTIHMSHIQLYPFADPNTGILDLVAVIPCNGPGFGMVYVDSNGERYVNEAERRDVNSMAALNSNGFPTFAIFNEEMIDLFTTREDLAWGMERNRVIKAATLEELVEKLNSLPFKGENINMNVNTLKATIERHNTFVENGVDEDFGKAIEPGMTRAMYAGPYYAIPQWPSVHHTMGGVTITPEAKVTDIWGEVIPGLFAAGEVTGGIHGTNRLGSNAVADALVFGKIAGEVAATGKAPVWPGLDK